MSVSIQSAIEVKDKVNWFFYGFVVSTILVGATTVQAWIYYTTNQDKWPLRTLVTALVFMDFALTFMNAEVIRFYLITNFGNVEVFTMFSPVLKVEILCSFVVIFVVNIFFASRVYKLQQAPAIVTLIVVATALGSVVAGLMLSVRLFQSGNAQLMTFYTTKAQVEMGIALVLATFSEILALTTISFSLHNSRTGYKQTDTVLKKLFTFFVSRGLVLAAAQIVGICVYFAGKHPLNWLTWNFISAKLYGITVLAMLASRSNLRKALGNSVSLSELSQSQQPTRTTRASTNVSLIQFTRREEIFYDNQLDSPVPKIALHSPTTDQFN
ncbi:hypothetical protein FB446DRAFT_90066 [Lentinula raphanica]|uniref:DUF6534 domain-containing protein n=1 Tax=Lentinula raphanica TaxID=153919 RepID=A0AA38P3G9_9AGAR|nr:hypothetical protein FB446DRAFT_90066 [Lentinula raphanica]KAJ3835584.1 hypothetical protein F5878DRAFT_302773 [Lentinula raphanica]